MKKYCERFDVYYDNKTGEYLEQRCDDPNCEYCKNRPKQLKDVCKDCKQELQDRTICKGMKKW
jgi:hypothetical protein